MPAATRSQGRQAKIDSSDDLKTPVSKARREAEPYHKKEGSASKARSAQAAKKSTQRSVKHEEHASEDASDVTIAINRAPVLELWAACVASFLYAKLSWTTCLSIGGAISTLCAISKGRSIGVIEPPDEAKTAERREQRAQADDEVDEVHVMRFDIKLKDGSALVGDKPKKANESSLRHKFGDEIDQVKQSFVDALTTWKGHEDDLNTHAFGMYEKFRPSVPKGQKGWGRQGQLSLQSVRQITTRSS